MKSNGRVGVNDKRHAPCSDDAIAQLGRDAQAADECIHDLRAQTEAAGLCGEPDDADGRDQQDPEQGVEFDAHGA